MKEYLQALHKRSSSHKKRFAFLVAGGVTLVIFAFWVAIVWSDTPEVAHNDNVGNLALPVAASPFDNILRSIKSTWISLVDLTSDGRN